MKLVLGLFAILLATPLSAYAGNDSFQSSDRQAHLLELFSTQSCSSCPPAQRWVSALKDDASLWKSFVPVVYHVDYWDHLGWKDPYSKKEYTKRQHAYARKWSSSRVYTPMFVLDGKEWRTRSTSPLKEQGPSVGVLAAKRKQGMRFDVSFKPSGYRLDSLVFHGALLANQVSTDVKSGENGGKQLKHDFLSLDLREKKASAIRGLYEAKFEFNSAPKGLESLGISFWVTTSDGTVLQAVGGNLSKGE